MQRHKWLSMHRRNGTNGCRCTDATALMAVDAQMWQPKRLTRHDAKPTEQARRARMHDSGRPKSLHDAATPTTAFRQPRHTSTITNRHSPAFFGAGGRTRTVRVVQGCTIAVAQSRYARMHNDSHTKPLHDATAQMAVDARCSDPNDRISTYPATVSLAQRAGYYFWCWGEEMVV